MYAPSLRRASAVSRLGVMRRLRALRPLHPRAPARSKQKRTTGVRGFCDRPKSAATAAAEGAEAAWRSARSKFERWVRVPSASSVAGAVALVPVVGGAWLVTVYALRQQLCEHRLQQVEGDGSAGLRRRIRNAGGSGGRGHAAQLPLFPGSSADARGLREMLELPASGITVLCVDPPASYTGEAFLRSALLGRAATVHIHAGEGDGDLAACLARGLGIQFISAKLQLSALWPGLSDRQSRQWKRGSGVARAREGELSDIGAILDTATAALEEIRDQAYDPRDHLPPVIVIDGLLGRTRPGGDVPAAVEAVLRWCWTITGGRRLAHVVITAPQSMVMDGSLVLVKTFLNDGRPSPGMIRVVGLDAPDVKVTERRFRTRLACSTKPSVDGADVDADTDTDAAEGGAKDGGLERAVALCMELVHGEGCGVAEEANLVLRRAVAGDEGRKGKNKDIQPSSKLAAALNGALEGIVLEAWRRAAAAVSAAAAASSTDSITMTSTMTSKMTPSMALEEAMEFEEEGGLNAMKSSPATGDLSYRRASSQELTHSGLLVDDYDRLEATESLARVEHEHEEAEQQQQRYGRRGKNALGMVLGAEGVYCTGGVSDTSSVEATMPATPMGRLVKLMGELADGEKVTVGRAVSVLNGDGKALGRLLDLGVLRLSPQTVSGAVSAVGADDARSSDVLPEANEAFQVGAATPVMAGVFAILRGCSGLEEQAIARAMRVLRGGNPDGHATELADHEEWQAYREAAMAGLVRRAMSGYGGAAESADKAGTSASRRLQMAMAAVGCMVTRREIESAIRKEQLGATQGALVSGLLKEYHRGYHAAVPDSQELASSSSSSIPNEATGKFPVGPEDAGASATSSSQPHAAGRASEESEGPREDDQDEDASQEEYVGVVGVDGTDGSDLKGGAEASRPADDDRGGIASCSSAAAAAAAADSGTESPHKATAPATGDHVNRPARGINKGVVGLAAPRDEADVALARDGDGIQLEVSSSSVHVSAEGTTAVEDDAPSTTSSSTTQQGESTKTPSSQESVSAGDGPVTSPMKSITVTKETQNEGDSATPQPEDQVDQDHAGVSSSDKDPALSGADAINRGDDRDDRGVQEEDLVSSPKKSVERSLWKWITRSWPGSGKNGRS